MQFDTEEWSLDRNNRHNPDNQPQGQQTFRRNPQRPPAPDYRRQQRPGGYDDRREDRYSSPGPYRQGQESRRGDVQIDLPDSMPRRQ